MAVSDGVVASSGNDLTTSCTQHLHVGTSSCDISESALHRHHSRAPLLLSQRPRQSATLRVGSVPSYRLTPITTKYTKVPHLTNDHHRHTLPKVHQSCFGT